MAAVMVTCSECGGDSMWNYFRANRDETASVEEREDSCGCAGNRSDFAQFDTESDALAMGESADRWRNGYDAERDEREVFAGDFTPEQIAWAVSTAYSMSLTPPRRNW